MKRTNFLAFLGAIIAAPLVAVKALGREPLGHGTLEGWGFVDYSLVYGKIRGRTVSGPAKLLNLHGPVTIEVWDTDAQKYIPLRQYLDTPTTYQTERPK
ncbi:hypothetical protein LCGC14_1762850 [marine sediment metagenome]|uniref:Uncharacterized protein n=1 Tax=marine sediment metagenome TaxID=412755 RepID=A0A0F9H0G7_9ZZZZ